VLSIILFVSCNDTNELSSIEISNKEEYFEFKATVKKTQLEFKEKKIDASTYAKRMEQYGDVYVKNVNIIPPERRYRMSIHCYTEALKYNKNDKKLKEKSKNQKMLFKVVNH